MAKDYYAILGVSKSATPEDIKKAFRTLAHKYHPDKKDGNADKFKEASEAYAVLSDPEKRKRYDSFGSSGGQAGSGFRPEDFAGFDFSGFANGGGIEFDLGDIFGDIFGGRRERTRKGSDIAIDLRVSFKNSVFGVREDIRVTKTAVCDTCTGTGAQKGSSVVQCTECSGAGTVREVRRSIIGSFATTRTCSTCSGAGTMPKEPCKTCRGKGVYEQSPVVTVDIPGGIEDGSVVRIKGAGEAVRGGSPGDLYVTLRVMPLKEHTMKGMDIIREYQVPLSDALSGAQHSVETLDGRVDVEIPAATQEGDKIHVRGKGVNRGGKRGDYILKVTVVLPKRGSKELTRIAEELRKAGH
jgi:molecular chaperone DnaJ